MNKIFFNIVKVFLFLLLLNQFLSAQPKYSQINSAAGSFSRLGFGARGMGMGNSMSSVTTGSVSSFYNPSLSVLQNNNNVLVGYSFLSLDRKLNFLNYSRNFLIYKKDDEGNRTSDIQSIAGISIGVLNSGVSNIDGRDNSGIKTELYSTSENKFFMDISLMPSKKFSFGVGLKYYYYKLFDKMTTTSLGFDVGLLYFMNDYLTFSGVITDINSKYSWDSTPLYEQSGKSNLIDQFPLIKKLGVAYRLPNDYGVTSAEFETSNFGTSIMRFGSEVNLTKYLRLRLGLDRLDLSNSDIIPKYTFGFQMNTRYLGVDLSIDYAFVREPYSPQDQHIVSLSFNF